MTSNRTVGIPRKVFAFLVHAGFRERKTTLITHRGSLQLCVKAHISRTLGDRYRMLSDRGASSGPEANAPEVLNKPRSESATKCDAVTGDVKSLKPAVKFHTVATPSLACHHAPSLLSILYRYSELSVLCSGKLSTQYMHAHPLCTQVVMES